MTDVCTSAPRPSWSGPAPIESLHVAVERLAVASASHGALIRFDHHDTEVQCSCLTCHRSDDLARGGRR
ncbi:MAG: hypothetical protein AAGC55_08150 [Myxococcota bacterium]